MVVSGGVKGIFWRAKGSITLYYYLFWTCIGSIARDCRQGGQIVCTCNAARSCVGTCNSDSLIACIGSIASCCNIPQFRNNFWARRVRRCERAFIHRKEEIHGVKCADSLQEAELTTALRLLAHSGQFITLESRLIQDILLNCIQY